ncbi:hypothetical protein BD413DRAFT_668719 [Trametes elegans]|nr:hypothetical protein BD413DRAFT_668719 [Trametes elegans]
MFTMQATSSASVAPKVVDALRELTWHPTNGKKSNPTQKKASLLEWNILHAFTDVQKASLLPAPNSLDGDIRAILEGHLGHLITSAWEVMQVREHYSCESELEYILATEFSAICRGLPYPPPNFTWGPVIDEAVTTKLGCTAGYQGDNTGIKFDIAMFLETKQESTQGEEEWTNWVFCLAEVKTEAAIQAKINRIEYLCRKDVRIEVGPNVTLPPADRALLQVFARLKAIGGGFVTIAWRGTVGVTSVVLKTNLYIEDMTDERPVAKEWSRLCEQVPSNPQEATALPIPAYHGWFVGVEADIIAMTYHGQSLDEIDDADGHLQDAYKRALDVLRNAGIEPNDIAPRNAVYDGSVVRCIDFV